MIAQRHVNADQQGLGNSEGIGNASGEGSGAGDQVSGTLKIAARFTQTTELTEGGSAQVAPPGVRVDLFIEDFEAAVPGTGRVFERAAPSLECAEHPGQLGLGQTERAASSRRPPIQVASVGSEGR
jgi:hypothetical protein